jgi:hypothetical protein
VLGFLELCPGAHRPLEGRVAKGRFETEVRPVKLDEGVAVVVQN